MKKFSPLLIMLAAALWSLDALLRRGLYSIPPATLVMLEHMGGVLVMLPFVPLFWGEYRRMKAKEWAVIGLTALVGGVLGTLLYTAALARVHYIQYSAVVLLQKTQPIFAVALAALVLREKITRRYLLLAGIGLCSAYLLSFPDFMPNLTAHRSEWLAPLMALGAAACWGSATVLGKMVLKTLSFGAATMIRFALVVPMSFFLALSIGQTYPISQITTAQWYSIAGIVFSSGTVAYLLYYKGLQHTPAKISTFAELTYPVSAVAIGYVFLDEKLTGVQMISAVSLLIVILVLSLSKATEKEEQQGPSSSDMNAA